MKFHFLPKHISINSTHLFTAMKAACDFWLSKRRGLRFAKRNCITKRNAIPLKSENHKKSAREFFARKKQSKKIALNKRAFFFAFFMLNTARPFRSRRTSRMREIFKKAEIRCQQLGAMQPSHCARCAEPRDIFNAGFQPIHFSKTQAIQQIIFFPKRIPRIRFFPIQFSP